jgi:hypothetical protein
MSDNSFENTEVLEMKRSAGRTRAAIVSLLAALALSAIAAGPASAVVVPPRVATGGATHVLATSALLTGVVNPNGIETAYFFRYGPTLAYGFQTAAAEAGAGTTKIRVGISVGGLVPGGTYHYRLVAVNQNGVAAEGRDRVFKTRGTPLIIEVPKSATDVFGTPLILTGLLRGQGAGNHRVALQASPFPYLEPFATIGVPGTTNALGRFSFRIANLFASTQLRVTTLDPLPVYSHLITVNVAVRVTLKVRKSSQPGLVRLYGKVSPAVKKANVLLQVRKAIRPGKSEATTRWASQFKTKAKKGAGNSSRFSIVVRVRHPGRYRAVVRLPAGSLVSGASKTVVLRAAPAR